MGVFKGIVTDVALACLELNATGLGGSWSADDILDCYSDYFDAKHLFPELVATNHGEVQAYFW